MRASPTLNTPGHLDDLILRLDRLQPTTARRWGTMTPHEMLCHVTDSFAAVLGDRPASSAETWLSRTVIRWIALHTPLPWPHGVPTRPEVDPKRDGTRPLEFERDRQAAVEHLQRFVLPDTRCVPHPFFGPMTRNEWMCWGYRHVDHHLRQFGL
jgi:hypothetical protein